MLDRQQAQSVMHEGPDRISAQWEQLETVAPVRFRLIADFVVEVNTAAQYLIQPNVTSEERRLFLTVLTTPEALNRMCRLAIVSDFDTKPGLFEGQFFGPQSEDILAAAMPYLSPEDQSYWTQLQQEVPAQMGDRLLDMFCEFKTALRRVRVEDVMTGEAIALQTRRDRMV
jgi:hypothetical protein